MGLFADKLEYLDGTKTAIKNSIIALGINIDNTDTFRSYATKINSLNDIKLSIKQSIINKGISVSDSDNFSTYPSKIDSIITGGDGSETDISHVDSLEETIEFAKYRSFLENDIQLNQGDKKILFVSNLSSIKLVNMTNMNANVTGVKLYDGTFYTRQQCIDSGGIFYLPKKYSRCELSNPVSVFIVYFDNTVNNITDLKYLSSSKYLISKNINISYSTVTSIVYFKMINCKIILSTGGYFNLSANSNLILFNSDNFELNKKVLLSGSGCVSIDAMNFANNPLYIDPADNSVFFNGGLSDCAALAHCPSIVLYTVTNLTSFLSNCGNLLSIDLFDTSTVNNMQTMFSNCGNLSIVPAFDLSSVVTEGNLSGMFEYCSGLRYVNMINIKSSLDISASTCFTRESLLVVINNLINVGSTRTLTIGAVNKAKLTLDDINIATTKQWSVV